MIAPELERKYNGLQRQLDERESKLDNIKNKLCAEEVNSRLRRLMARLDAEGLMNGAMFRDREPPPRHQPAEIYTLAPSLMPTIAVWTMSMPPLQPLPTCDHLDHVTAQHQW